MKYQKQTFKRTAVKILTYGTLASFLTMAPPVYDDQSGFLRYPAAHASSCFVAGTRILMADGSLRPIDTLRPGDRVVGEGGMINRIVEVERVPLAGRKLYGLNGGKHFVTAEHPFLTRQGWKSISPAMTAEENPNLKVDSLTVGDRVLTLKSYSYQVATNGSMALAEAPVLEVIELLLSDIDARDADPQTLVFNLLLEGNHSYIADGYLVHNKGGDDGGSSGSGSGSDDGGSSGSDSGSDDSSGSGSGGSDDDSADDSSGPGSGGDDDGDSSGSGSGSDDDDRSDSGSSDDDSDSSADDDDEDDDRGRGRGRGSHDFEDEFDTPDDSDGRVRLQDDGDDDRDDDSSRDRDDRRGDRIRTEVRQGQETDPDFSRIRTETRFDKEGNVVRQRVDERIGPETASDFQRNRSEQRFDSQGNVISDRTRTQVGPDDDSNDDSRNRSFRDASLSPSGPDLSPEEEEAAIRSGWQ